ncbi:hypothetical protein NDU88_005998 [Pleurodeles waltl]|uniref:Uncharacterized protein n=1 Tax=Pleurodeles waltl TaxID=8319 RepID=A0AAV7PH15_PLEWA|nr:hypothetical protein NDU88_005998 [Pleurodeles waltl]
MTLEGDSTNHEDVDAERWKAARFHEKDPGAEETIPERENREEEPGAVRKLSVGETVHTLGHVPGGASYLKRGTCIEDKGGCE